MDRVFSEPARAEEARIRAAYAKRDGAWRYEWNNPAHLFAIQDLERRLLTTLQTSRLWPLGAKHVLDVGCGTGYWLRRLLAWGAEPQRLAGIDLLRDRVFGAARLAPPRLGVCCGSAGALPFVSQSFDLVLQFMVFTSILDADCRRGVAHEMVRVLKPGGAILWFDFFVGNPRNPDVRPVKATEIRHLFPECSVELRRIILAPPVTRFVAPRSWTLCTLLNLVPPLRTHYLGVIKRR